jgi:hypothetical protein
MPVAVLLPYESETRRLSMAPFHIDMVAALSHYFFRASKKRLGSVQVTVIGAHKAQGGIS